MDEIVDSEGSRIDAFEGEIFLLKGRFFVLDAAANIPCFWTEENVEGELNAVDLAKCQW